MSTADTYVSARIDTETKERASEALESMGLSISDAIRLLMMSIAYLSRSKYQIARLARQSKSYHQPIAIIH